MQEKVETHSSRLSRKLDHRSLTIRFNEAVFN